MTLYLCPSEEEKWPCMSRDTGLAKGFIQWMNDVDVLDISCLCNLDIIAEKIHQAN